jgi:hypothetical protein
VAFQPVDHLAAQAVVQVAVAVAGAAGQLQHGQFVGFVNLADSHQHGQPLAAASAGTPRFNGP